MDEITLWARRFTVARGWRWVAERGCVSSTAREWLAVFKVDEPEIEFRLSKARPRVSDSAGVHQ